MKSQALSDQEHESLSQEHSVYVQETFLLFSKDPKLKRSDVANTDKP